MTPWLEIIVPVRNPGVKLLETGSSLAAQTERGFSVVLSDNFSADGHDILMQFCDAMKSANIPVNRVQPPYGLGRVQHCNWVHGQGEAEWLKPLFTGDLLKPDYMEHLHLRVAARPQAQIVRCEAEVNTAEKIRVSAAAPFKQENLTPTEFLNYFPTSGNWIGGLINVAYRRAAWQAVGGYPPHLPALGGLKLIAIMALRYGIEMIHEPLAISQTHDDIRSNRCFETWLILRELRNYCLSVNLPWPEFGVARGVAGSFFGKF
jgi:hypothetical protein